MNGKQDKSQKINNCVWLMNDSYEATGYLVCGEQKAVVIFIYYNDRQNIVLLIHIINMSRED